MSLRTPRHDPRRLTFSAHTGFSQLSNAFQSPYTPSQRRSTSVLTATPQLIPPRQSSIAPEPVEEAELYVATDLRDILRTVAIDSLTTLSSTSFHRPNDVHAADYVVQLTEALSEQLNRSESLAATSLLRPHTRHQVAMLNAQLRLEYDTWMLINAAWRGHPDPPADLLTTRLRLCPKENNLLNIIPGAVKVQRILAWLEATAADALGRSGGPQVKPLDDPAYRWEYTASIHDGEPVAIDFPLRDANRLEEVERKAEARLSREVYRLVRAGQLDSAAVICRKAGQPWRASALLGGKGAGDVASNGQKGLARSIWRKAAASIAKSEKPEIPLHERAVCAALSGILEPVLAVSETYEDQAWARLTILLDEVVNSLLDTLANVTIDDDQIIQTFKECKYASQGIPGISADLLSDVRSIHSYLALGSEISSTHFSELMTLLRATVVKAAENKVEWVSRLCTQICMFIKLNGSLDHLKQDSTALSEFGGAIFSYVDLVTRMDQEEEEKAMIEGEILRPRSIVYAIAASFMVYSPRDIMAVRTYGKLLVAALRGDLMHEKFEAEQAGVGPQKIEERRLQAMETAERYFPREILQRMLVDAVGLVWEGTALEMEHSVAPSRESFYFSNLESEHLRVDKEEEIIRSIELLVHPRLCNHEETLLSTTHAARRFFLQGNKDAARKVILWFPREILDLVPKSCGGLVREFQCWAAYMDAVAKYSEWHTFASHSRPDPLPDAVQMAARAPDQQISFQEQSNAKMKVAEYEAAEREYVRKVTPLVDIAIRSLNDALLYGGGWMSNVEREMSIESEDLECAREKVRREEIVKVRFEGTPQLAMLLHQIHHRSEKFRDAINLAVLFAGEDFKLYQSFGAADMRTFLAKIADSAIKEAELNVKYKKVDYPYEGAFFEEVASWDAMDASASN